MHAKPGIRVLEEVRAVEVLEAKLVGGKVGGDPVEDDPDSVLVQIVDEEHEVLRRSVAARRREVTGDLVAPRLVQRVLQHRHELDVSEAHSAHVVGQPRRELAVAEPSVPFFGDPHP